MKYYEWFEYLCSLFPFSNIGARERRSSINNEYDIEELKSAMTDVSKWYQVFGKKNRDNKLIAKKKNMKKQDSVGIGCLLINGWKNNQPTTPYEPFEYALFNP